MRIYILSMYEEHGAENVKATTNKDDVLAMLESYVGEKSPMGASIRYINEDEIKCLSEAMSLDQVGMYDLSLGWGGFHLDIVEEWSQK